MGTVWFWGVLQNSPTEQLRDGAKNNTRFIWCVYSHSTYCLPSTQNSNKEPEGPVWGPQTGRGVERGGAWWCLWCGCLTVAWFGAWAWVRGGLRLNTTHQKQEPSPSLSAQTPVPRKKKKKKVKMLEGVFHLSRDTVAISISAVGAWNDYLEEMSLAIALPKIHLQQKQNGRLAPCTASWS